MIINSSNFINNIENFLKFNFFLAYGPNFSKISDIIFVFNNNLVKFDKKYINKITCDSESILSNPNFLNDEIFNFDLFGNKKFVVCDFNNPEVLLKNFNFLKDFSMQSNFKVIIKSGELKKTNKIRKMFELNKHLISIPCYEDSVFDCKKKIISVLNKNNLKLDIESIDILSKSLQKKSHVFNSELEKILIFLLREKKISSNEINLIISNSFENFDLNKLIYAIISGKLFEIERLLNSSLINGINYLTIINALSRHFNKILHAKSYYSMTNSYPEAVKKLKPPIFFKNQNEFVFQTQSWPISKIEYFLNKLFNLEIKIKTNSNNPSDFLKSAIFSIAKTANRLNRSFRTPS